MVATSAKLKRGGMVEILMGEVENETNPVNGAVMNRRKDVVKPEQMVDMLWFEPATTETVPSAYYVPADATKAIELLKAHGIQMQERSCSSAGGVEGFAIAANTAGQTFEGHAIRKLEGTVERQARHARLPSVGWEVPMNQPLGASRVLPARARV